MTRRRLLLGTLATLALLAIIFLASAYHSDIPATELEALYANADSEFEQVLGSRVHFRDQGAADLPALLLIHGTSSSLHTWDGWVRELEGRFRILRLDLPGYGLTGANTAGDQGSGNYSNAYRVRVIEELMERRQVASLAVAGNSLGGLIAWRYAVAHPERVSATILINAAGAPQQDSSDAAADRGFRVIDLAHLPVARQLMTKLTPSSLIHSALRQVYADDSKITEELVERHHLMLLREGNRQAMVDAASHRGQETTPALAATQQPTLVMWGRQDTWIPVRDAETFHAGLPDSELLIYDHAGHVPMEEIPEVSARDAADFLERRFLPGLSDSLDSSAPETSAQPSDESDFDESDLGEEAVRRPAA